MFIGDWVGRRARLTPDAEALLDWAAGRRYTWAELEARAARLARLLHAHGIGADDRVSILAHNRVEHLDLLFAAGKLGAIFAPLNFRLSAPELAGILADCTPVCMLIGPECAALADHLRADPRAASVRAWWALESPEWEQGLAEVQAVPPLPERTPHLDDPACILYTGGTTGVPKGAVLSHGNLAWNSINTITGWGLRPDDVAPIFFPLFHTGGLNVLLVPLVHLGGRLILPRGFDADQAIDQIERERATIVVAVPTMYQLMMQSPRFAGADFASVRCFIAGGAPCPMPVYEAFWAKGAVFKQGYGLTEVGPNNFALPDRDHRRQAGSVGLPVPHADIRLVDDADRPVPPGQTGEIVIRGPHVCLGYWGRPAETAAVYRDGWWHTGDLARHDAEGYVTIVDRKKDMFISGGENVFPVEVEDAVYTHPDVLEAAVIGVPDARWGEVGRAVVVRRAGSALDEAALLSHLQGRLARYKIPKSVVFADSLPKNAAGKILKRDLRELHGGQP